MCRPTTCKTCRKTTWAGCGRHVADVKATVPGSQWCNGRHTADDAAAVRAAKAGQSGQSGDGGLLSRLFGR